MLVLPRPNGKRHCIGKKIQVCVLSQGKGELETLVGILRYMVVKVCSGRGEALYGGFRSSPHVR